MFKEIKGQTFILVILFASVFVALIISFTANVQLSSAQTPVSSPPPPGSSATCVLTSANWGPSLVANTGQQVTLTVTGSGCNGTVVSFDIYEDDLVSNDYITTVSAVFMNDNTLVATYIFTAQDYAQGGSEPQEEMFFVARAFDSNGNEISRITTSSAGSLHLNLVNSPGNGGGGTQPPSLPPSTPGQGYNLSWSVSNPLAGGAGRQDIFGVIILIINWIMNVLIPLTVIMIIYGGMMFMVSRGNPGQVQKAKSIIWWALVGFAVALIGKGFILVIESVLSGNIPVF